MNLKKVLALFLAIFMLSGLLVACQKDEEKKTETPAGDAASEEPADADVPAASGETKKIAVFYYQYGDTYISTVRAAFNDIAAKDSSVEILEYDGMNNQATQSDQIDNAIAKGVDILMVNIVDTGAAQAVIDKAKAAGLPVVFWNREPENADVYKTYDKSRFIGTRIEEAGILQGELIVNYWQNNENVDRNGDGVLDYVLLHGGQDNAEAIARSKFSVKALEDAGIKLNCIGEQVCDWDTAKAKEAMDSWLAKNADNLDIVIANNDGMAIGAINALQSVELNTGDKTPANYVGVFGVDATEEAQAAINAKTMEGTVKQDNVAMAEAIFAFAKNGAEGKDFLDGTGYEYDESGIAIRIPYAPFTGD